MTARASLFAGLSGRRLDGASYAFVLGTQTAREVRRLAPGDFVEVEQRPDVTGLRFVRLVARAQAPTVAPPGDMSWVFSAWLDSTKVVEAPVSGALSDIAIPIGAAVGVHRIAFRMELLGTIDPANAEVPAVLVDAVAADSTTEGVALVNRLPAPNETNIAASPTIRFDVVDVAGTTPVAVSAVYVNGVLAWDGAFQAGFSGSVTSILAGNGERFSVTRAAAFSSLQSVTVRVVASNANGALDESFAFQIADIAGPVLLGAFALDRAELVLSFDEATLLEVSGITIEYIQQDETVPAVPLEAVSVSTELSSTAVVVLDREMTPGALYSVTVEGVDGAGNVASSSLTFVGFSCAQPAGRDFQLIEMLPGMNVEEDVWPFDLRRFMACLQEVVDWLLCDIDRFDRLFDIDLAPERFVDAILADLGNPFPFALTLAEKRRLASLLVGIYRSKGTADGIINTVRLFTGIEIDITYPGWASGWELGLDELGVDTVLGTDDAATRYSYRIVAPVTLTEEERSRIRHIALYMQPAHEHLIEVVEPAPPPDIPDHWELGLSELGTESILH